MGPISVRVLGGLVVDGVDPREVGSRKARRLLEVLALGRGRPVPSQALVAELWPGHPPARPADQIAVLVSRLRARLGPATIERLDPGYVLHYGRLDLDDLVALTDRVRDRRSADSALIAARALGRLIGGAVPEGDHPWVIDRCAEVTRSLSAAVRACRDAFAAAALWPEAADAAARSIEIDPFDEEAVAVRMTALAATGRAGTALTEYHCFRRRLADELGIDPTGQVRGLYERILRAEPIVGRPAPPSPRHRPAGLVGRAAELAALDAAARHPGTVSGGAAPGVSVLVLEGEAGIGKTSLITEWAARRRAAGRTVLGGTCRPYDEAVPLDVVIVSVATEVIRRGITTELGPSAEAVVGLAGLPGTAAARPTPLADGAPDPGLLFATLSDVLGRIAPLGLIVDDAYLGGPMLAAFVDFLARRPVDVSVVLAVRPGEGEQFPGHPRLVLGPLDRAATAELVGPARADRLHERTGGHPLLLAELAREVGGREDDLPAGLVDSVTRRLASLGPAAPTLRAAAVLAGDIDPELVSGVLGRPITVTLADLGLAADRHLVVDEGAAMRFRHELIRQALATGVPATVAAGWHRACARILAGRSGADPIAVAEHARAGGDRALAARWLRRAADRAAARFDYPTAGALLDEAVEFEPSADARVERARLRTLTGRYDEALADVDAAGDSGPDALEVRAWACYFGRYFDDAREAADEGARDADDAAARARCLMIGGRTRHAAGDLTGAQDRLGLAATIASGSDRVTARAWLGILRAHQSRTDEALALLRPTLRYLGAAGSPAHPAGSGVGSTAATLHGLLFSGHAHALAGRPAAALHQFERYTAEVQRRQVPRFAGRGTNFGGWVLRAIGAVGAGVDAHLAALDVGDGQGTAELSIAARQDLAEAAILAADPPAAAGWLAEASFGAGEDLVFGWRLAFKARLLGARLALLVGDPGAARTQAIDLAVGATALGIPRYASVARLLAHRAGIDLGAGVDTAAVERDLDLADAAVALESWWWAGDLGAAASRPDWVRRAEAGAARLAAQVGPHADTFRRYVDRLVGDWLSGRTAPPAG